jgi:putative phage-type endonuclease
MTREEWLKIRLKGIGASEASAIVGMNPYKTNVELWEEKTGRREPEDISDKPYVKYGTEAEKHLRALFALDFPQYEVNYKDFDMRYNSDYPFIFATLDGDLTGKATGRKGILEIKTTEIMKSIQYESWKDKIPDNYYIQVVHQLLATGFDFAILKAQLKTVYGDDVRLTTKHYRIERSEVLEDIDYLLQREILFWECVEQDKIPNLILPPL